MDRRSGLSRGLNASLAPAPTFAGALAVALLLGLAPVLSGRAPAAAEPELLPPYVAFRLEAARPAPDRLRLEWTVAEGYYLYRERLRFKASAPARIRPPALPPGKLKDDPFFGLTEIYRGDFRIDLELEAVSGAGPLTLRIVSQGCADIGICFPPETRRVVLGVGDSATPAPLDPSSLESLGIVGPSAGDASPLPAASAAPRTP